MKVVPNDNFKFGGERVEQLLMPLIIQIFENILEKRAFAPEEQMQQSQEFIYIYCSRR